MELNELEGFENARFEILPVNKLFVDDDYQRNVTKRLVKTIENGFNAAALGVLSVSDRGNGTYAIYNGQHRFEGALGKGYTHLPCVVFPLSVEEEAKSFRDFNKNRASMSATELFWANVAGNEKIELSVLELVKETPFFITKQKKGGKSHNPYELSCVGALKNIFVRNGEIVLKEILDVLEKTWANDNRRVIATIVMSLSRYINLIIKTPEYDTQKQTLINTLNRISIPDFLRKISIYRETFGSNPAAAGLSVLQEMVKNYNSK
jgi:hypothetical protein